MAPTVFSAIPPDSYLNVDLPLEGIMRWFEQCDAAWVHDGDPKKPHAELTSGKCSNAFFDCLRVLRHPNLCQILANQLFRKLQAFGIKEADWVVGSAYAAITFSYEVAKLFGATHGFVEKDPKDPDGKRMLWSRMTIPAGARVLQVEELITTIGTTREVRRAVLEGNAEKPVNFLPVVGVLVHRPPKLPAAYGDFQVIAVIEKEVWAVDPPCDLCKAGSARYRPKTHWKELTGKA